MSFCCFDALFASIKDKVTPYSPENTNYENSPVKKNIRFFTYNELSSATNDFHPSNRIGRGGFGIVYKGVLRNGLTIAAKVLSAESKQGVNEFLTEINTISNVKHPNLVELVGCCVQGSSRILVYEYVENSSLDRALLGPKGNRCKLSWSSRSAICLGAAKGLAFLHEETRPHIVHRDIKASNILLDRNFVPKIGDFGLAKLFPDNVTHLSTRIAGTMGYLAPEYAMLGQLTKKADVYSFGVLILEIISGRSTSKSTHSDTEQALLEWTWQLFEEEKLTDLVDPNLKEYPEEDVKRYIKVALFCIQAATARRPSMTQVVEMLSKPTIRIKEKELTAPGLWHKSSATSTTSSSKSQANDTSPMLSVTPLTAPPVTLMLAR
ncbi:Non-specific serine/threonine protein kinase protein [Dioscorea alata]|uniref:Non-specific serine/threonine protein kinase protein n=1 Tax=Dioscorea alata TaxID=55571 RepID=A0ACB7V6P2_DIOAL|nr:Non-specific serine/threonine protein kinase protein [Dioscorea alata]